MQDNEIPKRPNFLASEFKLRRKKFEEYWRSSFSFLRFRVNEVLIHGDIDGEEIILLTCQHKLHSNLYNLNFIANYQRTQTYYLIGITQMSARFRKRTLAFGFGTHEVMTHISGGRTPSISSFTS